MLDRRTLLLSGAALATAAAPGRAQDYPSRPIRIVVPLAAGGMAESAPTRSRSHRQTATRY